MFFSKARPVCVVVLILCFCIHESFQNLDCKVECNSHRNRWMYYLRGGMVQCYKIPTASVYVIEDICKMPCEGYTLDEDQTACFCEACKQWDHSYMDYCVEPYAGPINGRSECDTLVCTGKAKFRGKFCATSAMKLDDHPDFPMSAPTEVAVAVPQTEAPQAQQEEAKKSFSEEDCLAACKKYEDRDLYYMRDGMMMCYKSPNGRMYKIEDICRMPCRGYTLDEDQTACFCENCKMGRAYMNYCVEPYTGPINGKAECDTLVCTGKAKFRGNFCPTDAFRLKDIPDYPPKSELAEVAAPVTEAPQAQEEEATAQTPELVQVAVPVTETPQAQEEEATATAEPKCECKPQPPPKCEP